MTYMKALIAWFLSLFGIKAESAPPPTKPRAKSAPPPTKPR